MRASPRSEPSPHPLRLAIVGCGAVADRRYLPAAPMATSIVFTHAVDADPDRAREVAERWGVALTAEDFREVLDEVDGVVVATPPASHAPIAIECLERGIHVLCEKPMADCTEAGRAMGEAARRSPALLSVGMVRRLSRSARLLRSTVERGILGELVGATVEEGGEFNWPLRTAHVFEGTKEGGALRDTGTHLIDLLLWVLGARGARLVEYRDDSWGGPEANALVELEVDVASGRIPARVEVSFTRKLENSLRIEGEHGTLEGRSVGGAEALFRPATGPEREVLLRAGDGKARTRVEDFALQLEAFARAVRTGGPPPVSPAEALPTASLIEECYLGRRPRVQPWETLPDGVSGSAGWGA